MYGCTLLIHYLCHYRQYKEIKVKLEEKFNPTNLLKRAGNEMSNLDFVLWNLSREPTPTTHKPQPHFPLTPWLRPCLQLLIYYALCRSPVKSDPTLCRPSLTHQLQYPGRIWQHPQHLFFLSQCAACTVLCICTYKTCILCLWSNLHAFACDCKIVPASDMLPGSHVLEVLRSQLRCIQKSLTAHEIRLCSSFPDLLSLHPRYLRHDMIHRWGVHYIPQGWLKSLTYIIWNIQVQMWK